MALGMEMVFFPDLSTDFMCIIIIIWQLLKMLHFEEKRVPLGFFGWFIVLAF